jgi:hypothetical protein
METTQYTTTVLTAAEGHKLTQAGEVDILARTITPKAFLAATDSPDNWREITDAEADALRAEIEAAAEREQSQAKVYAEVDE